MKRFSKRSQRLNFYYRCLALVRELRTTRLRRDTLVKSRQAQRVRARKLSAAKFAGPIELPAPEAAP